MIAEPPQVSPNPSQARAGQRFRMGRKRETSSLLQRKNIVPRYFREGQRSDGCPAGINEEKPQSDSGGDEIQRVIASFKTGPPDLIQPSSPSFSTDDWYPCSTNFRASSRASWAVLTSP